MIITRQGISGNFWLLYVFTSKKSVANTQIVGRQISYLYNQLRELGFRGQLHCVGHSLVEFSLVICES